MLIFLPLTALALFWANSYRLSSSSRSLRDSFLTACLWTGVCISISTELFSAFNALTWPCIAVFWLLTISAALAGIFLTRSNRAFPAIPKDLLKVNIDSLLLVLVCAIILLIGVTAMTAPPNNWDSMTYHMSRVAHWVQNKSVSFYPSSIPRQLWASPWAEFAITHLQILSQGDRFANLVQCFSMIASVLGCSLIARALGADRRGQIISAVLCASLPVGILEASSTQNDYVAALWSVCLIYYGLQFIRSPGRSTALSLALSFGLALSTKSTTLLFMFPFLIWIFITGLLKQPKRSLSALVLLLVMTLFINGPQFLRNYNLDGNPFSLTSESKTVTNELFLPQTVFSTALRYLGLNLCTSSEKMNQAVAQTVTRIHQAFHLNVMDPRFSSGEEYKIKQDIHEDNSCNTAYTIVFVLFGTLYFIRRKTISPPDTSRYFYALAGAFLLFCLLVRWQPWGNRLLLPLYVISVPFIAAAMNKNFPRLQIAVAVILVLLCIPWITHNRSRPLFKKEFTVFNTSRDEQYFSNIPGEFFSYQKTAQEILQSGCRDIGLIMTTDSWEYPLWPLLGAPKNDHLRIEHVNVRNPTQKYNYPKGNFAPCVVVHDTANGIASVQVDGINFVKTNQYTFLSLYRKDPDGSLARSVLSSNLQQMIRLSLESDQILMRAQSSGGIDQNIMIESLRLRRTSVDYAKLLDKNEMNSHYAGLGSAVIDLYQKGSELLLDGLMSQNPAKINEGQALLALWQTWLTNNLEEIRSRLK